MLLCGLGHAAGIDLIHILATHDNFASCQRFRFIIFIFSYSQASTNILSIRALRSIPPGGLLILMLARTLPGDIFRIVHNYCAHKLCCYLLPAQLEVVDKAKEVVKKLTFSFESDAFENPGT